MMRVEAVAAVLAQHMSAGTSGRLILDVGVTPQDLAVVLLPLIREREAAAWDEGWHAARSPLSMRSRDDGPNPYAADAPTTQPAKETPDD